MDLPKTHSLDLTKAQNLDQQQQKKKKLNTFMFWL